MISINLVHEHIVSDCPLTPDATSSSTSIGNHSDHVNEVKFKLSDQIKEAIENATEFHNNQTKDLEVSFSQVYCYLHL